LFLDSLNGYHDKSEYVDDIRNWLNHEWNRLKMGIESPFTDSSMPVLSPKSESCFFANDGYKCCMFML